jgi:5-methylcytosine-specific restriction endonuclease McrA
MAEYKKTTEDKSSYKNKASERATKWNRENRERRLAILERYSISEKAQLAARQYRQNNREEIAIKNKIWVEENRGSLNKKHREYAKKNPDKVTIWSQRYYQKNKIKHAEYVRKWRQDHPFETRLMGHNRRTKMRGRIIKEDISNWESRICGICNLSIDGKFDIDHIIPISRGGLHKTSNLQLAHIFCNRSKHNKLPTELSLQGVA